MILPDYDDGGASLDLSQSPPTLWKPSHMTGMTFDLSPEAFTAGPVAPMTPIIYGNGTMLSDIGEVTEVESTCGPSRSRSGSTRSEIAMVTSTALPYEAIKQRIKMSRMAHQRQVSVESNSTVTAPHDPAGLFVDFDDTVSVDDSNFQGDDEDSVADSCIGDTLAQETVPPVGGLSFDPNDARYSTPWGRRAEQILANAKRRLTTMEGNLNRARSSLDSPPSSSMGSHSTPSPSIGRPATAVNESGRRKTSHGHNRISSDGNIPMDNKPNVSTQRSLSALGTAGGYRRPLQGSRNADDAHSSINDAPSTHSYSTRKIPLRGHDRPLEPLSEDEVFGEAGVPGQSNENTEDDGFFNLLGPLSDKGLRRSVSSLQMRDLKDQVNDLKGRLSTLRDQARADSLKRRSLQSLRTPSPFTHARVEQWYAEASGNEDGATLRGDSPQTATERSTSPHNRTGSSVETETTPQSHDELQPVRLTPVEGAGAVETLSPTGSQSAPSIAPDAKTNETEVEAGLTVEPDDFDDLRTDDGDEFADANDFDESGSESGASSYHDTVQAQVSHEDREDAFDYEHFFLHSAMGSMSRRRMRRKGSLDSFTSEDSVETTRGPAASQPVGLTAIKTSSRSRRGSAGSTSTMESFATATEGRHTRVDIAALDEYDAEDIGEDNEGEFDQSINLPERARTHTPDTAKRMVFSPEAGDLGSDPRRSQSALHRRPQSSAAAFQHRSTISSLSTGTNRSFPLVNKSSNNNRGVLTSGDSPDPGLKRISETLMGETTSIYDTEAPYNGDKDTPMQMLQKEDQLLVQRLVANLGRCVLGLAEAGRASAEGRAYRRKIETARRALETFE
ncbi:hypothetical protein SAMD00023353_0802730 [Rosellinia necatrix]|uniref:Uncharacterized protein n=1 Tax=Rosellinia necatrix TaxID=77044 RepID=A0A1W2TBC3_ROSNE|nr:hypothetical protein SAMD00023353_0802730 [Rosellinia necatrix]